MPQFNNILFNPQFSLADSRILTFSPLAKIMQRTMTCYEDTTAARNRWLEPLADVNMSSHALHVQVTCSHFISGYSYTVLGSTFQISTWNLRDCPYLAPGLVTATALAYHTSHQLFRRHDSPRPCTFLGSLTIVFPFVLVIIVSP